MAVLRAAPAFFMGPWMLVSCCCLNRPFRETIDQLIVSTKRNPIEQSFGFRGPPMRREEKDKVGGGYKGGQRRSVVPGASLREELRGSGV